MSLSDNVTNVLAEPAEWPYQSSQAGGGARWVSKLRASRAQLVRPDKDASRRSRRIEVTGHDARLRGVSSSTTESESDKGPPLPLPPFSYIYQAAPS